MYQATLSFLCIVVILTTFVPSHSYASMDLPPEMMEADYVEEVVPYPLEEPPPSPTAEFWPYETDNTPVNDEEMAEFLEIVPETKVPNPTGEPNSTPTPPPTPLGSPLPIHNQPDYVIGRFSLPPNVFYDNLICGENSISFNKRLQDTSRWVYNFKAHLLYEVSVDFSAPEGEYVRGSSFTKDLRHAAIATNSRDGNSTGISLVNLEQTESKVIATFNFDGFYASHVFFHENSKDYLLYLEGNDSKKLYHGQIGKEERTLLGTVASRVDEVSPDLQIVVTRDKVFATSNLEKELANVPDKRFTQFLPNQRVVVSGGLLLRGFAKPYLKIIDKNGVKLHKSPSDLHKTFVNNDEWAYLLRKHDTLQLDLIHNLTSITKEPLWYDATIYPCADGTHFVVGSADISYTREFTLVNFNKFLDHVLSSYKSMSFLDLLTLAGTNPQERNAVAVVLKDSPTARKDIQSYIDELQSNVAAKLKGFNAVVKKQLTVPEGQTLSPLDSDEFEEREAASKAIRDAAQELYEDNSMYGGEIRRSIDLFLQMNHSLSVEVRRRLKELRDEIYGEELDFRDYLANLNELLKLIDSLAKN